MPGSPRPLPAPPTHDAARRDVLCAAAAAGALALGGACTRRPLRRPPGVLAPEPPEQLPPEHETPIVKGGYVLQPRARFSARVRVLSRERYYLDPLASLVPLDLAVGWGPMSDSAVLDRLDISQWGRFYYWRYEDDPPIATDIIVSHSANWHLIPGSDLVRRILLGVRPGAIVSLRGLLVDIEDGSGPLRRTSLVREDSGAGACEILYVESAVVQG